MKNIINLCRAHPLVSNLFFAITTLFLMVAAVLLAHAAIEDYVPERGSNYASEADETILPPYQPFAGQSE